MELIGRFFVVTLCVLAAYALPSFTAVNVQEENVMLQLQARLSQFQQAAAAAVVTPVVAVNNSQQTCTSTFTKDITIINNKTVNQTQGCYKSADATLNEFDVKVLNKTVGEVNTLSKNLQMILANCSAKSTNIEILVCYLETFDKAMTNLNNITSLSQVAVSSINEVEYSAEIEAKICVNQVLMSSKVNSSIAANDLQACLSNTTISGINGSKSGLKPKLYFLN